MDMTVNYAKVFCYTILPLLLLFPGFSWVVPAMADQSAVPIHNITLEFDLKTNSLKAVSRIELPAGMALELDLSGLDVTRILVNGISGEIQPENPLFVIHEADAAQEINITYSKTVPPDTALYNIISDSGITLTGQWFPQADHEMIFNLTAFIPNDFEAVSEAEKVITSQAEGRKQVIFRFRHPLYSINFAAGPYTVTVDKFDDDKELDAYFFAEDQELAAGYLEKTKQYLARYEKMIGPYPYDRFAIVENRLPTGFAMPTFTLLGQAVVRLPFIVDTSLGHEVLHSWFGNGVRMSYQEGNWVEGLTTYLADQSFAADKGNGATYRKEQMVKYQSYVRPDLDLTLRDFQNVGHTNIGGKPVRAVGYNKSSMFFHMLRHKLGDETFTRCLQDFYRRMKYKTAGWTDLEESFKVVSGRNLDDFFSQWLDRNDIPKLEVKVPEVKNDQGYPVLHFDIKQDNKDPYSLELPVVISDGNEEVRQTLTLSDTLEHFDIPLTFTPTKLTIDPDYDIMRVLAPAELPPTWSHFMGDENKIAILPSEEHRALYGSFIKLLESEGISVKPENEVTDKELAENSLLFLGTDGRISRSLFAMPDHPADSFTLDVRKNPLDTSRVAVLVSAADANQVEKAVAKLRHYEKYSYLSFKNGRIQEKKITPTDTGYVVELGGPPDGIETSGTNPFADIIARLINYQVIYIGEGHTNYEDHLLQLDIIRALYKHDPNMAIGMEMFTREDQPILDSYVAGELDEKAFLKQSHYFKTWRFDYRLYRDIINFAKYNNIPLVGLNLEKDIVSQVFKEGGPNSLPKEDISILPENRMLDIPGYSQRIKTAYMMHGGRSRNGSFSGFLQAQALWDETMAKTITNYLDGHSGTRMVIIAGRGHVDKINAIPPRVERRLPVTQAIVVNSMGVSTEPETADYIFFSPPASITPAPLLGVMIDDTKEGEGVLVKGLSPNGQAKAAGIREKDIILAIGPDKVNDIEDVKIAMLYQTDSDSVTVKLKRHHFLLGDKVMEVEVPLKNQTMAHP